ncbi:laccase-1 [Fopius arisanus]|uniref:Laccase-1 n=2 Tax=Fopius arisanus TaxID=64838 RepID=A0A9R1T1C6_9HYME|nr:PREDICTED: laccase-1-like [Fopius arisanus]
MKDSWNFIIICLLSTLWTCYDESHAAQGSYRVYSRSEGKYRDVNFTIADVPRIGDSSEQLLGAGNEQQQQGNVFLDQASTPEECARECRADEPPRTCYYHWTVEYYRTLGSACELCEHTTNTSLTSDCQCILADGVEMTGVMVINRMYPGPSIQVCLGDLVVVDVANHAFGSGLTIHFHGIYQNGYQYYDGVPFVTQCPITFRSTFRYKWRAQNAGTHFYHAHTGLHKPAGVEGAVIIRSVRKEDPSNEYYDEDGFDNVIYINDWFHTNPIDHWPGTDVRNIGQIPDNFLINGRGQWFNSTSNRLTDTPLAVINVEPNRRYRFRMINSLSWTCSIQMTIQDHNMTIIATDGEAIEPKVVQTINSFSAERYDFVLTTDQKITSYWIQVRGLQSCADTKVAQYAILRYSGAQLKEPEGERLTYDQSLPLGIVFNDPNEVCENSSENLVCVKNLQSAAPTNERISQEKADITIYIPFKFYQYTNEQLFKSNTYKNFEVPTGGNYFVSLLQNISNEFGASPYLTQMHDIPPERICSGDEVPKICKKDEPCFCSHLIDIPLNSVVELVMVDENPLGLAHPFHLHGYGFHVIGQGSFESMGISGGVDRNKAIELDQAGLLIRNLDRPPVKDTVATPSNGYIILRFYADNPGYWLYHCHFQSHLLVGMEMVFHVGDNSNLPPIPDGFPTCGDFKPSVWEFD